ncbi:MAG: hypothetical protein ABL908_15495 [Hyphomicrobium sp.]
MNSGGRDRAIAAAVLSRLREANLDNAGVSALLEDLRLCGRLTAFLELAHPKRSTELAQWLQAKGIPWTVIIDNYEWRLTDSLDVFFGVLAGFGGQVLTDVTDLAHFIADSTVRVVKSPEVLLKAMNAMRPEFWMTLHLAGLDSAVRSAFDQGLTSAPSAYARTVLSVLPEKFSLTGLLDGLGEALKQSAKEWKEQLSDLIGRLEFFKAGIHIGRVVGMVVDAVEAGVGLVKLFPKLALAGAKLLKDLPARLRALSKSVDAPQKAAALVAELQQSGAMDTVVALPGGRLPPGVTKSDLMIARAKGMLEKPDGSFTVWPACAR